MTWLADAAPSGTAIDLTQVLQFGFVGVVLLCLMLGKYLVPEWALTREKQAAQDALVQRDLEIKRLQDDIADLKAQLREANEVYSSKVVPTLTRVVDVLRSDGSVRGP